MNLAIIIGISEYETQQQLTACKNDAYIMKSLLDESKKYEDILYIDKNTTAQNIKSKIIDFINEHDKNDEIQEIFFYFSGHGWFKDNEFYYICSDFNMDKINSTTLKNCELDEMLKTLKAKLAIKVVDACNSGTRYVKGDIDKELIKNKMKNSYNKCYFMFSSQQDESSQATDKISLFTESFISSIINFNQSRIRYRDVMDYISDNFAQKNIEQTPFYVTQCDNTEYFLDNITELKEKIESKINSIINTDVNSEIREEKNIIEFFKNQSNKYCKSSEEVLEIFDFILNEFKDFSLDEQLKELYDYELKEKNINYDILPSIDSVARELNNNKDKKFFIETKSRKEKRKKEISSLAVLANMWSQEEDVDIIYSYKICMEELNYNCINIEIKSKLPNLNSIQCNVIFAFSRKDINIFYYHEEYIEKQWEVYIIPNDVEWCVEKCEIKDSSQLKILIDNIKSSLNDYITESINKKLGSE